MDLKSELKLMDERFEDLELSARKLPNHNFADVIALARGRLKQASDHPDVEKVAKQYLTDQRGANIHGIGPDTAEGANPFYDPAANMG